MSVPPDHLPGRLGLFRFPQYLDDLLRTVSFAFHVLPFFCGKTNSLASPLFRGQVRHPKTTFQWAGGYDELDQQIKRMQMQIEEKDF